MSVQALPALHLSYYFSVSTNFYEFSQKEIYKWQEGLLLL